MDPVGEEEEKEIVIGSAIERKRPMTKEDIQKMNLKKKTRKRTRKFEIDGVTVTSTTSKVFFNNLLILLNLMILLSFLILYRLLILLLCSGDLPG